MFTKVRSRKNTDFNDNVDFFSFLNDNDNANDNDDENDDDNDNLNVN